MEKAVIIVPFLKKYDFEKKFIEVFKIFILKVSFFFFFKLFIFLDNSKKFFIFAFKDLEPQTSPFFIFVDLYEDRESEPYDKSINESFNNAIKLDRDFYCSQYEICNM